MKNIYKIIVSLLAIIVAVVLLSANKDSEDERFVSYIANPKTQNLKLYWKDDHGRIFRSIDNLKRWLERRSETLVFAMNGGMYKRDNSPQGLFIQDGKTFSPLDTLSGAGNFYLKPNGVFYITNSNTAEISPTETFRNVGIKYATQSGPMLVINGNIHSAFMKGSKNVNIRNGVGILPDNKILFVMSKKEINFYDFALYFKERGCKNALYLDGLVSRTYLPEKNWIQTGGNFGVIIGISK